jgi:hypothetical protein
MQGFQYFSSVTVLHYLQAVLFFFFYIIIIKYLNNFHEYLRAHQTRKLLRLGFNEITQFLSKSEVLVSLSVFSRPYFFHQ